ncbi:MAG: hypothetical protein ACRC68_00440 [Clostridium sp.]
MDIISNEESLVSIVFDLASGYSLDDENWKIFRYKGRPKRGSFFNVFVKKKYSDKNNLYSENYIVHVLLRACYVWAKNVVLNIKRKLLQK